MGFREGRSQVQQHKVTFEAASEVFFDPFVGPADAGVNEETRDAVIGYTEDASLLFVVHLIQEQECIRIISARKATAQERTLL
jgi:uncharacterized protein